jgi:hypothetical protein
MSTVLDHPKSAAPEEPPSPTVTHYEQVVAEVSIAIDTAFAAVKGIEAPHPSTRDFVRTYQSVSSEFIGAVIAFVEATPELQSVNKFNVAEAKDTLQFIDAFGPLVARLGALARDLKFTAQSRKAKVAEVALRTYDMAKSIARDPDNAGLLTHVENMRRTLGRGRPRGRSKTPPVPQA